jgi:hypothetical protein
VNPRQHVNKGKIPQINSSPVAEPRKDFFSSFDRLDEGRYIFGAGKFRLDGESQGWKWLACQ